MSCEEVRLQLGEMAEGLQQTEHAGAAARSVAANGCNFFKAAQAEQPRAGGDPASGPLLLVKQLLLTKLGSAASRKRRACSPVAQSATMGASAGTTVGAGAIAGVGAAGGSGVAGGLLTGPERARSRQEPVAGLAAAAIVTAGAVAADHALVVPHQHPVHAATHASAAPGNALRRPSSSASGHRRCAPATPSSPTSAALHGPPSTSRPRPLPTAPTGRNSRSASRFADALGQPCRGARLAASEASPPRPPPAGHTQVTEVTTRNLDSAARRRDRRIAATDDDHPRPAALPPPSSSLPRPGPVPVPGSLGSAVRALSHPTPARRRPPRPDPSAETPSTAGSSPPLGARRVGRA